MNIEGKVDLMGRLGEFILSEDPGWAAVCEKASYGNGWFIPEFIRFQLQHIATQYLAPEKLRAWISSYEQIRSGTASPAQENTARNGNPLRSVGIVMAGNIPLAGFHDFLSAFMSGHRQVIKPSSKDDVLIRAIIDKLIEWEPSVAQYVTIAQQLKNCDAYIATGSNNSSRYFDYYFGKYPHIIRRNRTSVAVLTGDESSAELELLADDVYIYFGLGCRNVTKIYIPRNYDFVPLLEAFKKYNWLFDNHKYKNNYDYQLAIMIINKIYYMTNGSILLRENSSYFSPISQLHYEFYDERTIVEEELKNSADIQCIVGYNHIPFGQAQKPSVHDYADKADTLKFLLEI